MNVATMPALRWRLSLPRRSAEIDRTADGSCGVESGFQILRPAAESITVFYGCGRCLDEIIAQAGRMLFRKRTVIYNSPRIDRLLVIPV